MPPAPAFLDLLGTRAPSPAASCPAPTAWLGPSPTPGDPLLRRSLQPTSKISSNFCHWILPPSLARFLCGFVPPDTDSSGVSKILHRREGPPGETGAGHETTPTFISPDGPCTQPLGPHSAPRTRRLGVTGDAGLCVTERRGRPGRRSPVSYWLGILERGNPSRKPERKGRFKET